MLSQGCPDDVEHIEAAFSPEFLGKGIQSPGAISIGLAGARRMMARDSLSWMWVEACEMLDRAERLQRQFFQLHRLSQQRPRWEPPVDIFETAQKLKVVVLLPGVPRDLMTVSMEDEQLIITGERPLPFNGPAIIHRLEIPYGRFEKRIQLPSADFELLDAELVDGCLALNLEKCR